MTGREIHLDTYNTDTYNTYINDTQGEWMSTNRELARKFDAECSLGFLLYKAHQKAAGLFRRALERHHLTPQQFGVLALLYAQDRLSQAEIGERAAIDPNTMVGILDRLEGTGLVERGRHPTDRRVSVVRITAAGRVAFEACMPIQQAANQHLWSILSPAEQEQLRTMLRRVMQAAEQAESQLPAWLRSRAKGGRRTAAGARTGASK